MTSVDVIGRVQNIQATLDMLSGINKASAAAKASAPPAASSQTDFSRLLNDALGRAGSAQGSPSGMAVKDAAMKYIGVPYVFGGEDASGMDCSGLVQRVYADLGIEVPRLVSGQMHAGTEVASLAEAQPGDLIVTDNAEHIVIYAGDNKVIHAPYEGRTVSHVERWFDESDIVTIRRIVPNGSAVPAPVNTQGMASSFLGLQGQGTGSWSGTAFDSNSIALALAALSRASLFGPGTG